MKNNIANSNFMEAIKRKIPKKPQLVNALATILSIEKEAVYRRLRGEVPFSFEEAALVSQKLGISLDYTLGIESEKRPFNMNRINYEYPSEKDFKIWREQNEVVRHFSKSGTFQTYETWTIVPFPYCYQFPFLTRFYIMKWSFQVNNHIPLKKFSEIHLDEEFYELSLEYYDLYMQSSGSQYIVSNCIFSDLVSDIQFFYDLHCISDEDRHLICHDMELCIDNLEHLVTQGIYEKTNKSVNVYVTDLKIDSNYTLMQSDNYFVCMLRTLNLDCLLTTDETTYNYLYTCFTSLKRLTTHISFSGEKDRIKYFSKERAIVKGLKELKLTSNPY